ncbi:hypothetical protein HGA88_04285 [Candidatus Roizmanbacteria bacterium]|nr:hypothetical protein [Candidatus Roizmanbacteria bacterium]
MGRKLLFSLATFLILAILNVAVATSLLHKNKRVLATQKILDEISRSSESDVKNFGTSTAPLVLGTFESKPITEDGRAANLKSFFRKYNSPLYDSADFIVQMADKYQFDYRLLPAIAMQESNLCRVIPNNSYNCWGWGIYGSTVTRFDSYTDAIETVSRGLKQNYIDHGLVTATDIMSKYNPSSNGSWAHGVNTFLDALE